MVRKPLMETNSGRNLRRPLVIRFLWIIAIFKLVSIGLHSPFAWGQAEATDMVILIDRSGSMRGPGGDPEGLSMAAVQFLLDQLELAGNGNRAALVLFDSVTKLVPEEGLTADFEGAIRPQLDLLKRIGGNTDLEEALLQGMRLLSQSRGRKQMVLISDGKPEPDFQSARASERFPDQYRLFAKSPLSGRTTELLSQLSEISTNRISKLLFGLLKENGVEVYPLAMTGIQAPGEDLLRQMAMTVSGDAGAFKKVVSRDMIQALNDIVPKPESLLTVARVSLEQGGQRDWSAHFEVQEPLLKLRVMILYREPSSGVSWKVQGPAGTFTPQTPNGARYSMARHRHGEGKLIFERFFLDEPPKGSYRLDFQSSAFLPAMDVIVEGRTDLRLTVDARPQPSEVGVPTEIFCGLIDSRGFGLKSGNVSIVDPSGVPLATPLDLRPSDNGTLTTRWTPSAPGSYLLKVVGYLNEARTRYLTARYVLRVHPPQAVQLRVVIPKADSLTVPPIPPPSGVPPEEHRSAEHEARLKGPSFDSRGESLDFQTLTALRRRYEIEGVLIENTSNRNAAVSLSVQGLRHVETNFAMNPEDWFSVTPDGGSATSSQPLKVAVSIHVPSKIPVGLPDGLYTAKLVTESPVAAEVIHTPIRFTLDLPDFFSVPTNAVETGLTIAFNCCLPDTRTVKFALTTDALQDQEVSLIAPMALVREETGESLSDEKAWIRMQGNRDPESRVRVSRQDKGPTKITLEAKVNDSSLPPGRYSGQIAVYSHLGRAIYVPVHLWIPNRFWVDRIRPVAATGAALVLLFLLLGPVRLLTLRRRRFMGDTITVQRRNHGSIHVPPPWNRVLDVVYHRDQNAWLITSPRASLTPERSLPGVGTGRIVVPVGRRIAFGLRYGGEYRMGTVSSSSHQLRLRLHSSPYRKGPVIATFALGLVVVLLGSVLSLRPEWLCQFIP